MNISDLSKEAQKKILLVLIAAILVIGVLYLVGLPLLRNRQDQKEELEALNRKIAKANELLGKESESRALLEAKGETLETISSQMIPPNDNRFLWATEQLTAYARNAGIEVDSVNEILLQPLSWDNPLNKDQKQDGKRRHFVPYRVKADLKCNYAELKGFIHLIEQKNKYATVSALSISAQDQTPNSHRITLAIEWPTSSAHAEKSLSEILDHDLLDNKPEGEG